jgi:hypothetical protein
VGNIIVTSEAKMIITKEKVLEIGGRCMNKATSSFSLGIIWWLRVEMHGGSCMHVKF